MNELLKFCIVGAGGLLIDIAITYLGKSVLHANKYVASSVGFTLAATFNYTLNRIWTFQSCDPAILVQYIKFMVVCGVGLALSNILIYLFNEKIGMRFYTSKLVAMTIVTLWNYFMNAYITFG